MKKLLLLLTLIIASCTKEVEVEKIVYQENTALTNELRSQLNNLQAEFDNLLSNSQELNTEFINAQNQIDDLTMSLEDSEAMIQELENKIRFTSFYNGQTHNAEVLLSESNNVTTQNYPLSGWLSDHINELYRGLYDLGQNVSDGIISYEDGIQELYAFQGNHGDLSTFIFYGSFGKWYGNTGRKILIHDGQVVGYTTKWSSPNDSGISLSLRPGTYADTNQCWDDWYLFEELGSELRWYSYGKSRSGQYTDCEFSNEFTYDYDLAALSISQVANDLIGVTSVDYNNIYN